MLKNLKKLLKVEKNFKNPKIQFKNNWPYVGLFCLYGLAQ